MATATKKPKVKKPEENPFKILWMNSCYQQTLLPDAPWHKIEDKIAESLTLKVERQFGKPERKEALLQNLGGPFVSKYLPDADWNPQLLEPPNMAPHEKQKILKEAQAYLNSQMYKCVKDIGYQKMLGAGNNGDVPQDYSEFMQHSYNIFNRGLDRELYRQEQELSKKKLSEIMMERKLDLKIPAPSRHKVNSLSSSISTPASEKKPSSAVIKDMVQRVDGDPPPLWGPQSDAIGRSILAVLERDPRKFDHVARSLHGRQLPGALRSFMWSDVLFKEERKRLHEGNVEKVVRERFAKAVSRGIEDLKISRATYSPIHGLIQTAVIETYNKTTSMVAYKSDSHIKESCRALNVLYVYDRSYEPYLIHWLFPLQLAFQRSSNTTTEIGEHVYEVAMYLDLLNSSCFPTWPQVFAIAEQVMNTMMLTDPDLYTHLKSIATTNVKVNKKEFLHQLISIEKAKAEELLKATPGSKREENITTELLADPLVFFRRWIGEVIKYNYKNVDTAFLTDPLIICRRWICVLDTPGVMYVWDQLFMQNWSDSVLKNFSLALVELLRYKFMEARDYKTMKEVFLFEPSKLYTVDIQMAWIHLESGKDLMEVPYLNRRRIQPGVSRMSQLPSAPMTPSLPGLLPSVGLKCLVLKLVIPSEIIEREPWVANIDAKYLKLNVTAYFGSVRLRTRMSLKDAIALDIEKDNYGNTVYEIYYLDEKFLFENLDIAEYDVEKELGANPYCMLKVEYTKPGTFTQRSALPVGWARVPLFQRDAHNPRGGRDSIDSIDIHWLLQNGDFKLTLHPGDIPEVSTHPSSPTVPVNTEDAILGYHSELLVMVYDPREEPPDRARPPGLPAAMPLQVPPADTRHSPTYSPKPSPRPQPKKGSPHPQPRIKESPKPKPRDKPRIRFQDDDSPWVEYKPDVAYERNETPTAKNQAFDLYIDGVRFITDNSSIVKVTGIIGAPDDTKMLLTIPDLDKSARCPVFQFRLTFNEQGKELDDDVVAFLRVYTWDVIKEEITVIGSCFVPIFDKDNGYQLNVGGHQLRLHNGVPPQKPKYHATDLDNIPVVPGASILVRVLPSKAADQPAPSYGIGYYKSEPCRPTASEKRIFSSYKEHMMYPKTVRDMIQRLQQAEGQPIGQNDEELLGWLQDKLDVKKYGSNVAAGNLPLDKAIRYRVKMGINVKIQQAHNLPEGIYLQCFARVQPGEKVVSMPPTEDGHGEEEKFITLKLDFESFQKSPVWTDDFTNLHPFYDENSVLLIQLYGLDVKYTSRIEHDGPGKLRTSKDQELSLGNEQIIGWTVVPLFEGNSVMSGTHELPIFKGQYPEGMLEDLTNFPVDEVFRRWKWDKGARLGDSSIIVDVWDGHFDWEEVPVPHTYKQLMLMFGKEESFVNARKPKKSWKKISAFVVDGLEKKQQKLGTEKITKKFYDLMEDALMTAGFGPLKQTI
ncbi:unnamed protein product [Mytilus coruscus]|uniref:Uncharacterized protein n=1 Tax=Mytilus coruscus TaxID=42192 RepID=A0A6J8APG7_MYTCO|nr:unnamed protein product [Mytilus coruscus]